MAKRLGGQIGVERAENKVETGYRKLSDLNRRRGDRFEAVGGGAPRESAPPASGFPLEQEGAEGERPRKATGAPVRPGYVDLVKMSFAAARAEHRLKTLLGAVASLFAIFGPVEDFASPEFVRTSDKVVFAPIEGLVLAVRELLSRNAKNSAYQLRIPYFQEILAVIRDWDIEGISRELARLQRDPRGVTFADCRQLCVLVFIPLVRLGDLDPSYHLAMALKHLHDLDLLALPKQSPDAAKVRLRYAAARDALVPVFRRLKERCYPLLMKLAAVRYSPYPEFFRVQRGAVLAFLALAEEQIVPPKELSHVEPAGTTAEPPSAKPSSLEAASEAGRMPKPIPEPVVRGLEFLAQLFPRAGFERLSDFPDLYPYFQPLFSFPHGVELIPPEDPLQQVIVLIAVLQQLFYAFRAIRFRTFTNAHGERIPMNERIEGLTANWHLFLDEVIGKNYANSLDEVCRQLERNRDFLMTDYGDKLETDLLWTKRRFLLPLLKIRPSKGTLPSFGSNLPRLQDTVRELRETIDLVIADVESKREESVENPWDDLAFAIEDSLSKRIRLVLSRRVNPEPFLGKRVSNINLIFHAGLVLAVLDYLTTSPDSFYYAGSQPPLYRTELGRPGVPQYRVLVENPYEIIAAAERAGGSRGQASGRSPSPPLSPREAGPGSGQSSDEEPGRAGEAGGERRDRITGMALLKELTERVAELLREEPAGERPFVFLALSIRRFSELSKEYGPGYAESALKAMGEIIAGEIRLYLDVPYRVGAAGFVILLPDSRTEDALHLARRLAERFHATVVGPEPMAVSIGCVEYRRGWSLEQLLKLTEGAIREAAKRPFPSIMTLSPSGEGFLPVE